MANEVDEIKQRLDIVEVIQEYVPLKKSGSHHKACCPFHQEKSPSFMVNQSKQIWHCFGCHEGGDIFTFLQKIEGLEFYDALKLLADKAGVTITKQSSEQKGKKQVLLDVLEQSTSCFHEILLKHPKAEEARAYIKERGINEQTIKDFQLGYAPDSWDALMKFLLQKKFSQQQILDAGLAVHNKERNSIYDRFRNRFMIPLRDVHGRIVGFTARALGEDFEGGKYINTPQTLVYDKSSVIFGLSKAKQAIKQEGHAVLVEGNMDVISSHQAGVMPVVAVSGTALTEKQLNLLKRFTEKLIFAFDADQAGLAASLKGIELALRLGFEVRILTLPQGKDPDECIQAGIQLWKQAIEQSRPIIEHLLSIADTSTLEGKKLVSSQAVILLRAMKNPVERDHYQQMLAQQLQVSISSLEELLRDGQGEKKPYRKEKTINVTVKEETAKPDPHMEARKEMLALVILEPKLFAELEEIMTSQEEGILSDLYKELKLFYGKNVKADEDLDFSRFSEQLPSDLQTTYHRLQMFGEMRFPDLTSPQRREAFQARKTFFLRRNLKRQIDEVQRDLRLAEQNADEKSIINLTARFQDLSDQLIRLET